MMIIIFWEMVLIRATRCHLPEDDNPLNFLVNQILIVTVIPKYLNCAAFSKDLLAIFML
jgi:hypothetical protein